MCCGQRVPATVEAVQSILTARRLTASEQALEWLSVSHTLADPQWMRTCMAQAEAMADVVEREQAVRQRLGACVNTSLSGYPPMPDPEAPAERSFTWLGESRGTLLGVLRDGIGELARQGFIAPDLGQRAALRRALGVSVNAAEAAARGPWVRWMAEADALNYLVESLWQMNLISCPGGRRYKWQTLCGAFLRADGRRFEPSIKNNRCSNPIKCTLLDESLLNALRFTSRQG